MAQGIPKYLRPIQPQVVDPNDPMALTSLDRYMRPPPQPQDPSDADLSQMNENLKAQNAAANMAQDQAQQAPAAAIGNAAPEVTSQNYPSLSGGPVPDQALIKSGLERYDQMAKIGAAQQGAGLESLKKYINSYEDQPEQTNYVPLGHFADYIAGLAGQKGSAGEAAQAMAPASPEKRQEYFLKLQEQLQKGRKDYADTLLNPLKEQLKVYGQMIRPEMQGKNAQDRLNQNINVKTNQFAQNKFDQDTFLNTTIVPRLEGAARVMGQLNAAANGKIVSNAALLAQLNAEQVRLENGAGAAAEGSIERQSLLDAAAEWGRLKDSVLGKGTDAVRPEVLNTMRKGILNMGREYIRGADARIKTLRAGMFPNQQKVMDQKREILMGEYFPIFQETVRVVNKKTGESHDLPANNPKAVEDAIDEGFEVQK